MDELELLEIKWVISKETILLHYKEERKRKE